MDQDDPLYSVLDYILNRATSAQLEVIGEALKRRSADTPEPEEGLNPRRMAQRLSRNIEKQLGASLDVPQIARRIVRDLIKHKEPGIQEREVEVLLDNWLPGTRQPPPASEKMPPDALASMVATFLAAERGSLSPEDSKDLPADWKQRYWQSFPPAVREAIEELRQGRSSESDFWAALIGRLQQ
jgi:uncharacterized protein with HEPN domain